MAEGGVGVHQVRFRASPIKSDHILPSNLQPALDAEGGKHGFVDDPMDNYSDPDMEISMTMEGVQIWHMPGIAPIIRLRMCLGPECAWDVFGYYLCISSRSGELYAHYGIV